MKMHWGRNANVDKHKTKKSASWFLRKTLMKTTMRSYAHLQEKSCNSNSWKQPESSQTQGSGDCHTLLGRKQISTMTGKGEDARNTFFDICFDQGLEVAERECTFPSLGGPAPSWFFLRALSGLGSGAPPLSEPQLPRLCTGLSALKNRLCGVTSHGP